jgi:amino acid transporter
VTGTTAVNVGINVVQISALLIFAVIAFGYRVSHPQDSPAWTLDPDGVPTQYVIENDKDGKPVKDADGNYVYEKEADGSPKLFKIDWGKDAAITQELVDKDNKDDPNAPKQDTFQFHENASSVVAPHGFSFIVIQACIAILILVGFESVTSMGEEAKNAKRDIPRAVLLSLFVQGVICYLIEYFAAGYFLNSGYTMTQAAGSSAPIGDMMLIVGANLFGSPTAGKVFMLIQAFTVFLALIGTTLSCISTGARVTYAMGRDDEVPSHFGMLHGRTLTPHRAIWTLATVSAVVGIFAVCFYLCGPAATDGMDSALTDAQKGSIWYSFGTFNYEWAKTIPNSLLVVTLVSNFGTFMLYMLTCIIAIVAFREHHTFSGFKHVVVPVFGLVANLVCMLFYLIGPWVVTGMSWKESYLALAVAAVWGIWGAIYFAIASKAKGKPVILGEPVKMERSPASSFN